jgi:hypothetical protein
MQTYSTIIFTGCQNLNPQLSRPAFVPYEQLPASGSQEVWSREGYECSLDQVGKSSRSIHHPHASPMLDDSDALHPLSNIEYTTMPSVTNSAQDMNAHPATSIICQDYQQFGLDVASLQQPPTSTSRMSASSTVPGFPDPDTVTSLVPSQTQTSGQQIDHIRPPTSADYFKHNYDNSPSIVKDVEFVQYIDPKTEHERDLDIRRTRKRTRIVNGKAKASCWLCHHYKREVRTVNSVPHRSPLLTYVSVRSVCRWHMWRMSGVCHQIFARVLNVEIHMQHADEVCRNDTISLQDARV